MSEEQQYRDGLERLLKEAADDFSIRPSASVWEQVAGQLPSSKRRFPYKLAAAALIVLLAGAGYFYLRQTAPVPSFTKQTTEHQHQQNATADHSNRPQNQAVAQTPKEEGTVPQPISQDTTSYTSGSGIPESHRQEELAYSSADDEVITLNPLYNAFAQNDFAEKKPFSLEIPLRTGLSHSLTQDANTSFTRKHEFPFTDSAQDISLSSSLKSIAASGRKWSWGFYVTPSVTYRSFNWSNGKSPGNTIAQAGGFILSDTERVYHHSAVGLSAGFYVTRELARQWSASIGLGVSKSGYRISAISNGTINSNPPPVTSSGMSAPAAPSNDRNYFVNTNSLRAAMPSHPVTLKNQYYQVNVPIIFHWKQSIGKKSTFLELSPGITMDYLFDNETNIFAPSTGIYFKDPSLIRHWNTSIQLGAAIDFPVSSGWQLGVGPQFRYQLLSTYPNGYEVQEHPYSIGMKVSLSRKK